MRQLRRAWTLLRRIPCEALMDNGAPCPTVGYVAVEMQGRDGRQIIHHLCDAHADALLRLATLRFRDGTLLTTDDVGRVTMKTRGVRTSRRA